MIWYKNGETKDTADIEHRSVVNSSLGKSAFILSYNARAQSVSMLPTPTFTNTVVVA